MMTPSKATIRAAVISLLMAAAVYLITRSALLALWVVGVAAAIAVAGLVMQRRGATPTDVVKSRREKRTSPLGRALLHDRLPVRFATLFGLVAVLFVAAWFIGYHLLPERALAAAPARGALDESPATLGAALLQILAWNLTLPLAVVIGANLLLRINGYPLGYAHPLLTSVWYGLILGSNSFAVPMPARMAPSLAVLQRAGPYEFAGYCLIAVATYGLARFEMKHFLEGRVERVTPSVPLSLTPTQWLGLASGIALIVLAGWREAAMIAAISGR